MRLRSTGQEVEDKEQIRKEGFLVPDLQDIEGFARSTKKDSVTTAGQP